jgi:hypothetical protein
MGPHLLSADNGESSRSRSRQRARSEVNEHRSMWDRLNFQKIGSWLKREDGEPPPLPALPEKPQEEASKAEAPDVQAHEQREEGQAAPRARRA